MKKYIIIALLLLLGSVSLAKAETYGCGDTLGDTTVPDGASCGCEGAQWEGYEQWHLFYSNMGICCGWVQPGGFWSMGDQCLTESPSADSMFCGSVYGPNDGKDCICGGGGGAVTMTDGNICCGWLGENGVCNSTDVGINDIETSEETLNNLNPISVGGGDADLTTPGGIISKALGGFVFPIAGIILFIVLLLGGFQMLTGATNSKSLEEGKQRITSAIIGFLLLFAAYWIAQLLELIFGIRILS